MRVYEVAREFKVEAELLLQLFREMGVHARSEASTVDDVAVAKLRARLERERRSGTEDRSEAIEHVLDDVQTASRRRRRRRKEDLPPKPDPEAELEAEYADEVAEAEAADVAELFPETEEPAEAPEEDEEPAADAEEIAAEAEAEEIEAEVDDEPIDVGVEPEEEAAADLESEEAVEDEVEEIAAEADEAAEVAEEAEESEEAAELEEATPRRRVVRLKRAAEAMPETPAVSTRPAPAASAGPGGTVRIQAEGYTADGRRKRGKKKKRDRVDQGAVQSNVQRVMAELKGGKGKRRRRGQRETADERAERELQEEIAAEQEAKTVKVNEFLTVAELSELIDETPTTIVGSAFRNLGLMVTINQRLDFDQIELLLEEFGFTAEREEEYGADLGEIEEEQDAPEDLQPRPPVVTVMGHVDHGKTRLLDYIRKANVVAGESGGITQHIGAYAVQVGGDRTIAFLDTPGHAAFTAMRARGAEVTDVVILVVAADDSVMPQTIEAISHAKNAGVPLIVAINKVDLPTADVNRVRQQLLEHEVVVESYGGEVLDAEVSALKGDGVDALLEKVLLQAELLELKANPDRDARGVVIESQLDVGKGAIATVLVTNGTLRVGDSFVCGNLDGRVRALLDERGNPVDEAGPSTPVQVLGLPGVPESGDAFVVMDAAEAAEIAQKRSRLDREKKLRVKSGVKLTDIGRMLAEGETAQLNVVIKGDVHGSVQALSDALEQLSTAEVQVDVIHRGVGGITESDVLLASTSGAIVIGFHVRPDSGARGVAEREDVDIRLYDIIYEAVNDVRSALEGMLTPDEKEVVLGSAEVRALFKVPRIGTVAGCYVTDGVIERSARVRLIRDSVQIYEGVLGSLKRFKDDAREVREGFECGMSIEGYNDIKVGDTIEAYRVEQIERTLEDSAAAEPARA
jgi:translation initiation factor IF-2